MRDDALVLVDGVVKTKGEINNPVVEVEDLSPKPQKKKVAKKKATKKAPKKSTKK